MLRPWFGLLFTSLLMGAIPHDSSHAADPEPDPESVLKAHGLKASGWVYVVESEAAFHSQIIDARSLYQEWMTPLARLNQMQQQTQAIQQLTAETNALKQSIGQMRQQMSRGGYGGRRGAQFRQMQNLQIAAEVNEMQANLNQMNQQLTLLKQNVPKPQDRKKVEEEVSQRRDALRDAVVELGKLSDAMSRNYHELHRTNEIETALARLGHNGDMKPKLGPSREHLADVKILQKLQHELGISGSHNPGATRSVGKHHLKASPQPKKKSPSAARDSISSSLGES